MSVGTQDGIRIIHELVTSAKARPEIENTAPGGLGQLVAGVQHALDGKTIRQGAPDLHARVQRLKDWIEAHPEAESVA